MERGRLVLLNDVREEAPRQAKSLVADRQEKALPISDWTPFHGGILGPSFSLFLECSQRLRENPSLLQPCMFVKKFVQPALFVRESRC